MKGNRKKGLRKTPSCRSVRRIEEKKGFQKGRKERISRGKEREDFKREEKDFEREEGMNLFPASQILDFRNESKRIKKLVAEEILDEDK